jgi:hypothetical protein
MAHPPLAQRVDQQKAGKQCSTSCQPWHVSCSPQPTIHR